MSYLDPSENYVFRCPQCTQFISSMVEVCRFCQLPITPEIKAAGAAAVFNENKEYRVEFYKKVVYVGLGMFAGGLALIGFFVASMMTQGEGTFFYIGPILAVAGLGQILVGLNGIYREKRSKFKPIENLTDH